ncbi:hypothetical protein L873DRAFT_1787281 [Choiromyces venosus 120613-1]|uniref:Uncharacterized protein n=1 Tax=Choiromyces venosus 120613-1 TaxID=1336337 RepID=A0A3N4JY52_9PEZI|nr:hypothetical protein L873DRAFT_1787281 [Choiromyces venosus 120613-1]
MENNSTRSTPHYSSSSSDSEPPSSPSPSNNYLKPKGRIHIRNGLEMYNLFAGRPLEEKPVLPKLTRRFNALVKKEVGRGEVIEEMENIIGEVRVRLCFIEHEGGDVDPAGEVTEVDEEEEEEDDTDEEDGGEEDYDDDQEKRHLRDLGDAINVMEDEEQVRDQMILDLQEWVEGLLGRATGLKPEDEEVDTGPDGDDDGDGDDSNDGYHGDGEKSDTGSDISHPPTEEASTPHSPPSGNDNSGGSAPNDDTNGHDHAPDNDDDIESILSDIDPGIFVEFMHTAPAPPPPGLGDGVPLAPRIMPWRPCDPLHGGHHYFLSPDHGFIGGMLPREEDLEFEDEGIDEDEDEWEDRDEEREANCRKRKRKRKRKGGKRGSCSGRGGDASDGKKRRKGGK